jgi:hypothetical protein
VRGGGRAGSAGRRRHRAQPAPPRCRATGPSASGSAAARRSRRSWRASSRRRRA